MTMTDAESYTLVFKNDAGDYFLLPQEMLERGRVPAEQKGELEQLIAQADDVQGHIAPLVGAFVFFVGFAAGFTAADEIKNPGGAAGDIGRQGAAIGTLGKILSNPGRPQ
jgi:hypothetical protein